MADIQMQILPPPRSAHGATLNASLMRGVT